MLQGDYVGTLGALHVRLHITAAPDGTLSGTLDSPDQDAWGLECANVLVTATDFAFDVPAVHGRWVGKLSGDAGRLPIRPFDQRI